MLKDKYKLYQKYMRQGGLSGLGGGYLLLGGPVVGDAFGVPSQIIKLPIGRIWPGSSRDMDWASPKNLRAHTLKKAVLSWSSAASPEPAMCVKCVCPSRPRLMNACQRCDDQKRARDQYGHRRSCERKHGTESIALGSGCPSQLAGN